MTDSYTATVRTSNEQIYNQLKTFARDTKTEVEEVPELDMGDFAGSRNTEDEYGGDESTVEQEKYILYSIPFVYGDSDDEDAVEYSFLSQITGTYKAKVDWPDDDIFCVQSPASMPGDVARDFFDGNIEALKSFKSGDHSYFGDTEEDAIQSLILDLYNGPASPSDIQQILKDFLTDEHDSSFVRETIQRRDLEKSPFQHLGIDMMEVEGCYFDTASGESFEEMDQITNFTIKPLADITYEGDTYFEMRITPSTIFDSSYEVVVPSTVFNDKRRFLDEVLNGKTQRFDGTQKHLNDLREYVGSYPAPEKTAVDRITIQDGYLVTPNGTLSKDGWVDDAPYVWHTRTNETVENRWMLSPEDDIEFDEDEVIGALELLPQIRENEEILPVTGWFYAAVFSETITEIEGGKNTLNITGSAETGKSLTMKNFGKMMGMDYPTHGLIDCEISKFATKRVFNGTDCVPMLFDEYTPSRMPNNSVERFKNALKQVTGGTSTPKGQQDQSLIEWELHAPVGFNGEQAISGNAETRRSIMATFYHGSSRDGSPTAEAWSELTGETFTDSDGTVSVGHGYDMKQHALAWYLYALDQYEDRDNLVETYTEAKRQVQEWINPMGLKGLQNMHIQGFATILFGNWMANDFAEWLGHEGEIFSEQANKDAIKSIAETIGLRGSEKELDQFIYYFGMAAKDNIAEENNSYKWVHFDSPNEELRVNIDYAFNAVQRYLKETGQRNTGVFDKADEYKRLVREAADENDPAVVTVGDDGLGQNTPPINRAVGFNVDELEDRIDGFNRFMFADEPMHQHDITESAGFDAGEIATSVGGLSMGLHSLTVKVDSQSEMPPAHFEEDGYLKDATGKVRYVIWSGGEQSEFDLEVGESYCIKDAKVTEYEDEILVELDPGVSEVLMIDEGEGFLPEPTDADSDSAEVQA